MPAAFAFQWAFTPGILLALVAILTALIYKVSMKDAFKELWVNVKKMKFAMLTIGASKIGRASCRERV